MLISPEHGVLTPGAAPPVFEADYWPVPVKVVGTAASGQMMVIDQADMVYRLISGRVPAPVWRVNSCHQRVGVVGYPAVGCHSSSRNVLSHSHPSTTSAGSHLVERTRNQILWHT